MILPVNERAFYYSYKFDFAPFLTLYVIRLFLRLCYYHIQWLFCHGATPNWKKKSSTRKINYCVLSICACAKLIIFLSVAKFLKWAPSLNDTCNTSQCKKYRKLWKMDCIKFAQGWEVLLLIDPNDKQKNIILEITSY